MSSSKTKLGFHYIILQIFSLIFNIFIILYCENKQLNMQWNSSIRSKKQGPILAFMNKCPLVNSKHK